MTERKRVLTLTRTTTLPNKLFLCFAGMVFGALMGTAIAGASSMAADLFRGRSVSSVDGLTALLTTFVADNWPGGAVAGFVAAIVVHFAGLRSFIAGLLGVTVAILSTAAANYLQYPHFGMRWAFLSIPKEVPVHAFVAVIPAWLAARLLRIV